MKVSEQKQMAQATIKALLSNQKKGDSIAEDLIILLGATDENFENPLTQELEEQMDTLTGDKLKALKASIKFCAAAAVDNFCSMAGTLGCSLKLLTSITIIGALKGAFLYLFLTSSVIFGIVSAYFSNIFDSFFRSGSLTSINELGLNHA